MPLNEIQCKDGLKLFKRNWEDHPVCVKDASIEKLTLRNYLYVPFGSSGEAPSDESESNLQEIVMANNMCQNNTITRNDTGTFLTCILSDNAKNIFELQSPVYKLETCTSMHGCGWQYVWTPQIQSDLISEEQKQQVIDQILHLPQTNNWPASPQLNHFLIFPNGDKWMANVEFYIAGVKMPQHNKCEYFDSVEINLETLDIQSGFRNFTNFETCKP